MKKLIIDLEHHISGNYGIVMDKLFGYSDLHWKWYFRVVDKHLKKEMKDTNKG